mmetsp:Transcript_7260/g.26724  ORF Transcript_7260/g.26724 Transcript_7260/m.26724 type:complete len:302 (+) Transcript_7260:104-1009(+)
MQRVVHQGGLVLRGERAPRSANVGRPCLVGARRRPSTRYLSYASRRRRVDVVNSVESSSEAAGSDEGVIGNRAGNDKSVKTLAEADNILTVGSEPFCLKHFLRLADAHRYDREYERAGNTPASYAQLQLVKAAANKTAVPPFVITGALAYLESIGDEVCTGIDLRRRLHGRWRLLYSSQTSVSVGGTYLPLREDVINDLVGIGATGTMTKLEVYTGPLFTRFEGPCEWIDDERRLRFRFNSTTASLFSLGPWTWRLGKEGSPRCYRFFYASSLIACARSEGAGLVLLRREEPEDGDAPPIA